MKVGDLVRWVMEEYEFGVIVGFKGASLYRVFCLADGCFYYANPKEIEAVDESG